MTESDTPTVIVHHHYLPIRGWYFQKGNYVMVQFLTEVPESEIANAFKSPTSGSTIDTELVNHFKGMPKGAAIKLPKDDSITTRSLKVRVNKAAKEAGRKLEWAEVADGHIARVVLITTATNGVVAPADVPAPTSETPSETPAETTTRPRR
jgi:hypothetical protein